ncbi:MAG: pentapeptide repeat-containing protein [Isosphaeraceae bacterium]
MSVYTIIQRWTARPIALVEAPTIGSAVEAAVARGVSLLYADLRGICLAGRRMRSADLRGADLALGDASGAELGGADLRSARLVGVTLRDTRLQAADLRQADLREADLRHADLRDARLTGAELRGAIFRGARLDGALLDWRWSAIPLELLRRHPGAGREGSRAVAHLAFAGDERPFLWLKSLLQDGLAGEWALGVLADHVRPDDNAPSLLRRLTADAQPPRPEIPTLWTRPAPSGAPRIALRRA